MFGLNVLYIHFAKSWCCQLITNLLQVLSEGNTYCTNTQFGYWYFLHIFLLHFLSFNYLIIIIILLFIIIIITLLFVIIIISLIPFTCMASIQNYLIESIKQNNGMYKNTINATHPYPMVFVKKM